MKLNLIRLLGVVVLTGLVISCTSSPASAPTPTPVPTQGVPAQIPPTATITALPTATSTATSTSTPVPTSTPRPPTATPTQTFTPTPSPKSMLMVAINNALAKLKSYRVKVPEEGRVIEVILPDKFHQIENEDIRKIGGTLWMWRGGQLRPQNIPSVPFFDRASLVWYRDEITSSPQAILLGPATVEKVPVIGYQTNFTVTKAIPPKTPGPTPQLQAVAQPVKIWIGVADGFPRRIELGAPNSISVIFYDFNANIEIGPP